MAYDVNCLKGIQYCSADFIRPEYYHSRKFGCSQTGQKSAIHPGFETYVQKRGSTEWTLILKNVKSRNRRNKR